MFYTHSWFQADFFCFGDIFQAEILSPFNTGAHTDRRLCRRVTQRSHLKLNQRLWLDTQAFTRQQRRRPRVVFLKSALRRSTSYSENRCGPNVEPRFQKHCLLSTSSISSAEVAIVLRYSYSELQTLLVWGRERLFPNKILWYKHELQCFTIYFYIWLTLLHIPATVIHG